MSKWFRHVASAAIRRLIPLGFVPKAVGTALAAVIAFVGMAIFIPEGSPSDIFPILTEMWG